MHLSHRQRRRRERALVVSGITPSDAADLVTIEAEVLSLLTRAAVDAAYGNAEAAIELSDAISRLQLLIMDALQRSQRRRVGMRRARAKS